MNKSLFLVPLLLASLAGWAQINREAGSLDIHNFQGTAAVIVKEDVVRIQKGNQVDSFVLKKENNTITLANASDSTKIYELLGINAEQLAHTLAEQAGATPIAKLLDVASKMNEQKLIIKPVNSDEFDAIHEEEGAQPLSEVNIEPAKTNWLWTALAGVAALIIGLLIGRATKQKTPVTHAPAVQHRPEPVVKTEPTTGVATDAAQTDAGSTKLISQLKEELELSKERSRAQAEKVQRLLEGDLYYYQAVFDQIILPLQEALERGNKSEIVKYLNLAMVQLSSITRVKVQKKLKFDDANIQLITGNLAPTREFPVIDRNTPIDQIPANLRVLIELLQDNGVEGLGESIVKGYKLKNL